MDCIFVIKLRIILSLLSVYPTMVNGKSTSESVLVVALPEIGSSKISASWERGHEILPGAFIAVERMNSGSRLVGGSGKLALVIADSGQVMSYDYSYSGNVLEVLANLTWQNTSIVGIAGLLHPNLLVTLQSFQLPIASLIHFNGIPSYPNIIYVTASTTTLIDSILVFVKTIKQTRICVITEIENSYHLQFLHEVNTKVNVWLSIPIALGHHQQTFAGIVKSVAASNVYTILLNVSPFLAVSILCEAYKSDLLWPKYAWILHSYRLNDVSQIINNECAIQSTGILEGIFIFQLIQEEPTRPESETNPYSHLLYDAVWALASVTNQSSNQLTNASGTVSSTFDFKHTHSHIYIYQVLNATSNHVGLYNSEVKVLENLTIDTCVESDLPVIRMLPPAYFLSLPIVCFISNTVLLVLYIIFRNEPSVKSTSVCLSLLIFTGCYLLIAYTIVVIADIPPRIDVCMVLVWLSGLGLSLPLILATVLVKMLRVYRIFTLYKRVKPRIHTSECAHFLYTVIILSPLIAVLLVWTIIDPHRLYDTYVEHPRFIIIEERCISDFAFVWFLLLLIYYILLSLAVIIVAVKSRKIRLAQFKDTKKVNFHIFAILFIGGSTFAYSNIFASTEDYFYVPAYILYFGHVLIAFLCQITLFVPKIWPPLRARISKNSRATPGYQDPLVSATVQQQLLLITK